MITKVIMPQMGESIAEDTVVKWLKNVGDLLKRDEPLFEISTDKVDAEISSPADGILNEILVEEGQTVPVNEVVALIGPLTEYFPSTVNTRNARIFMCYRRDDSEGQAGRLFDRLSLYFGKDKIFMDIDTIEPGDDFVEVIEREVVCCDVLLALIGKRWLSSTDSSGHRRLDNQEDFVHLEIATALERDIRVIPVLVQGANMPLSEELPATLVKLARRSAIELSSTRWQHDVECLIQVLEKALRAVKEPRRKQRGFPRVSLE